MRIISKVVKGEDVKHIGIKRRSGRYPWGSGEDPYQHEAWNLTIRNLRASGLTDIEIAKGMNLTTTEFRAFNSFARERERAAASALAYRLKAKGYSNVAIGARMGRSEAAVRQMLRPHENVEKSILQNTMDVLENQIKNTGHYIDIGAGSERYVGQGVSATMLKNASKLLERKGYEIIDVQVNQLNNPGKKTTVHVIAPPGTTYSDVKHNMSNIHLLEEHTYDGGKTFLNIIPPKSIDRKRIFVRYGDEGGSERDGTIELRKGVKDISLGNSTYAQVRIAVDDKYYMKGMAIHTNSIPDGYDIVYNTNKPKGSEDSKVFKKLKLENPDNPFGATIKPGGQHYYETSDGKKELSVVNIVNEEGDWNKWSKTISSQILSKQEVSLAKQQLNKAKEKREKEFEEINNLTNPVIKAKMLIDFGEACDKDAVTLKAAALPRQSSKVIIPIPSLKDDEVYAPTYRDGERVVLLRHPHGGRFEIPELIVNNRNKEAKGVLGNSPKDAIGINSKVAERLSGADFDGDTVIVIPNNSGKIKTSAPLKGLKDFDPKVAYPKYNGMRVLTEGEKEDLMGNVSNLITDMTLKNAPPDDIVKAVRHSMVVIDAVKHELNYKQSYIDNSIGHLKEKYQQGGASTVISRAKSPVRVLQRQEVYSIDPVTGEKIYKTTGRQRGTIKVNKKTGEEKVIYVDKLTKSTKMAEAKDAAELSSGTKMEEVYVNYANSMKALGNKARLESTKVPPLYQNATSKQVYAKEVASLESKLVEAERNRPLERKATIIANETMRMLKLQNPTMTKDEYKKKAAQAMAGARARMGAGKKLIDITDREFEAIQAGAISANKLSSILLNADSDRLKELATPRKESSITSSTLARAKSLLKNNTIAEVADMLGISASSLIKALD